MGMNYNRAIRNCSRAFSNCSECSRGGSTANGYYGSSPAIDRVALRAWTVGWVRRYLACAATDYEVIATVFPVVADSAAALAKTKAATPSSNEGEQGSPVRIDCAKASSSA